MFTRILRYLTTHASLPKPARVLLGDTGISLPLELPPHHCLDQSVQYSMNASLYLGEIAFARGRLCTCCNIGIDPRRTQASTHEHHDR